MSVNIKTPQESTLHKGGNAPSNAGKESEPGYKGRTPGAGGPTQKVYENVAPSGNLTIKTPGEKSKKL